MSKFITADLEILACTDDQIRDIVNIALFSLNANSGARARYLGTKPISGKVSLKEFLSELGQTSAGAQLEFSRKKIPDGFRDRLQRTINLSLSDADKEYLFNKIPKVRSAKFESEAAIRRSFDASDQRFANMMNVGQIDEYCTPHDSGRLRSFARLNNKPRSVAKRDSHFKHGYYVLFTSEQKPNGGTGFRLSAMEIVCERPFSSRARRFGLPIFRTERYDLPSESVVDGIMFQPGDSVYTVGQIRGRRVIRVSKLNFSHRPERPGRYDLYGLRLGHKNTFPSCHRIFAYQIVRDRRIDEAIEFMREEAQSPSKGVFDGQIFNKLRIHGNVAARIQTFLTQKDNIGYDLDVPPLS